MATKYTVSIQRPYLPSNLDGWIADVEALTPEPRVLLRNRTGNLEACLTAIRTAILGHIRAPWGEAVKNKRP